MIQNKEDAYIAGLIVGAKIRKLMAWLIGMGIFTAGFILGFILDHFTIWIGVKPWPFG